MLFKLTGTCDLSKDDIENLKAHGFGLEFKKDDERKENYCNTAYNIIEYYSLYIEILTLNDLLIVCNILQHELIINKTDSKEYYKLEVYNGYRE